MSQISPIRHIMSDLLSRDNIVHMAELRAVLDTISASPAIGLHVVAEHLLSIPEIFAYIISVWDRSDDMISQIISDFPTSSQEYPSSLANKMLDTLSMYFLGFPPESLALNVSRNISRHRGHVEAALPLLCALNTMTFTSEQPFESNADLLAIEPDDGFIKLKVPQKMSRRNRQKPRSTVDVSLFDKLDVPVPRTSEEATLWSISFLKELKDVLSFYFSLLRKTELAGNIEALLLPRVRESGKDVLPVVSSTEVVDNSTKQPGTYLVIQPVKVALYFDNADKFGEWRILISTEAGRNLREFRRADRKIFKMIFEKIKQLSNGYLSGDNHKRLNGSDAGVPIHEAKITWELGLVYQVDCVPDHDGQFERQVIKIYGTYNYVQLDRIWDALGSHLALKGREYRRRCMFRNKPVLSNNNMILPASFPPAESEPECIESPPDLSDKDMDRLHSLLVLEKYVTFSQAFLHSLIAKEDVEHVFELTTQERKIVECDTSCYVLGRSGTGKTTTMLFKILGIQRAWEMSTIDMPKPRQIFVTKSRVLATKVEEYFTKLLESLALAGYTLQELAKLRSRRVEDGLIDVDDTQMNVPMRYSELEDKHFPLFITFDRLAKMIAADIFNKDNLEMKNSVGMFLATGDAETLDDSFITYEVFANQYWPRFPQGFTKNLNPWLVFSEIMGIIKGSEHALSCPEGVLDRPNYHQLPPRSNPNFANHRGVLYDIFEVYTKLKRQRRHYDVADRSQAIIKALRSQSFPSQQVDYLYVDEAQDNLLIDAFILRRLCRNPDGLFWAGDTAQTISAGSSFRFDDLKAFLYHVEGQNASVNTIGVSLRQPTMFQLAVNYRSHSGIVNCARSVVELITRFWPNTIDHLQPEKGVVDGLKPVFFTGWDKDTVHYEQFLFGASGSHIEFGAEQCILVRNEVARDKLRKEIGDAGIIMTIYESKGLEFNDVLLYNFFEDSVVDLSRWRIVLNGVEGELHAPDFERDEARYAGVCSELKLLYVGITRARKNMWIVDKSDKSDPMRVFWTSRNQVKACTPGTDVPHLAVSSTPEEWAAFGRSLFSHKHYSQASDCFERAGLRREVKVCEAYRLREIARSGVGVVSLNDQKRAFIIAADSFADCGAYATSNEKHQYYRNAADCYIRGGDDVKAADAYVKAEEFELAAKGYRKAGRFDRTLHVLDKHGAKIPGETTEELWTVCRLFYCSRNTHPPSGLRLFPSSDEELEFLEDYDLDDARISFLETHSRYYEVAELHLSENRPLEAVQAFIRDTSNTDSTTRAADTILEYLWHKCSFRVSAKDALVDERLRDFIKLADQLPANKMEPLHRDLMLMFQSILRNDYQSLDNLWPAFIKHGKQPAILLCLDHVFSQELDIQSFSVHEMAHFLEKFHAYAQRLRQTSMIHNPTERKGILKLFSIVQLPGDEFLIPKGTFLYSSAVKARQAIPLVSRHPYGCKSSRRNITKLLRLSIRTVLKDKVLAVNGICYGSRVFSQCLTFVATGSCEREPCPQEHVPMMKLDRTYYNTRVAIHIWQILILQIMYSKSAHPDYDRRDIMRNWLSSLYEALNPAFFVQGSLADLDMNLMPFGLDGMKVVKAWIRESFYSLDAYSTGRAFSTALMRITGLCFAFDRSDAPNYIPRAKCIVRFRPVIFRRKEDNRYMVEDLLSSYHAASESSISSGILFILHILDNRIYSNLSVLCDCIEDVCSSFIIKCGMDPEFNNLPLHDVVLPCNWLIFPHKFTTKKEIDIPLMCRLLDEVARLVEALCVDAGIEFLWLNQTQLTPIMRIIFISRICRILCLVAQNIKDRFIKEKIEKIILSLHRNIPPLPWHTANYWKLVNEIVESQALLPGGQPVLDGYVRALVALDDNKGVSDLVHLVHKQGRPRIYPVRQLLYEDPVEIPILLSSYALVGQSTLKVVTPVFVPPSDHPRDVRGFAQRSEQGVAGPPREEFGGGEERSEDDNTVDADVEATDVLENEDDKSSAPDLDSPHTNPPSEEENAARKIQKVYRRYARYRSSRAANTEIDAIFMACLRETQSPEWRRDRYSLLFLGPLPHLLVCLDRGVARTQTAKAKGKKLFSSVSHERLEELGKQRSKMVTLLKKGKELRKQLEPSSPTHRIRDINVLIRAVEEVKEFMHNVPASMDDLQPEFQMAYKGIVAEKKCKGERQA